MTTHAGAINILQTALHRAAELLPGIDDSSATNLGVFVQSFLDDTNFVRGCSA